MPIFDITFSTPLLAAFRYWRTALRSDSSPSRPSRTISPIESSARYGFTAAAP